MLFKEVIGQNHIKSQLIKSAQTKKISHTQMFLGNNGYGSLAMAIAYAQYINCEDKQENDSCGKCKSCIKYKSLAHPDLHFVFPIHKASSSSITSDTFIEQWREINTKQNSYFSLNNWLSKINAENAQGLIYASESNEIIRKISIKASEASYKVMIIWMPERMHNTTANKLLKILEEPPQNTLFLLVAEQTEKILPTIISRTQILKLSNIDTNELSNYFISNRSLESERALNLAMLSEGDLVKANEIFNATDIFKYNFKMFVELMRLGYARKVLDLMKWSDEIAKVGRERQKLFLEYASKIIRENFIININQKELVNLTNQEKEFSRKFYSFINESNVVQIYSELNKAYTDIENNAYGKLVFLDLCLKLVKLIRP